MGELDYRAVAEAEVQPMRLAILRTMLEDPPEGDPGWSAKTIADRLGLTLARASHHFRALAAAGLNRADRRPTEARRPPEVLRTRLPRALVDGPAITSAAAARPAPPPSLAPAH
jgi:DNA-binding MarR family transcriptional regulator